MKGFRVLPAFGVVLFALACSDGHSPTAVTPESNSLHPSQLTVTAGSDGADPGAGGGTSSLEGSAAVITDKDDYQPGDLVTISGTGWWPGETVRIHISEDPPNHADWEFEVVADAEGGFTHAELYMDEDHLGVTFTLTATGDESGMVAGAVFTDGDITDGAIEVRDGSCTSAETTFQQGSTVCAHTTFTVFDNGSTNVLVEWFGPDGVLVETDDTSYPNGATGPQSFSPTLSLAADAAAGEWTVRLCRNNCSPSGRRAFATFTVEAAASNSSPTADAGGPYNGDEGSAIQLDGSGSSDDDGTVTGWEWSIVSFDNGDGGSCEFVDGIANVESPSVICDDNGTLTVSLVVTDDDGEDSAADQAEVTVANVDPTAVHGGPYSGNEGSAIALSGSATDPGSNDTHTYQWSVDVTDIDTGGACTFDDATKDDATVTCNDDSGAGTFTLKLVVTDDDGGTSTEAQTTLDVANVDPVITSVTVAPFVDGYVYDINHQPTLNAEYDDDGSNDTHMCVFEVFDAGGSEVGSDRTCGAGLGVTGAGVYTARVTVTDDDGGSDESDLIQFVVYDPEAGFVTGGGWIHSPEGAYVADPSLTGKATFGFVSKYRKGATKPDGNTQFVFHAAGMSFHSSDYEWLVVNQAGTNAQYKGSGTINGSGDYRFMLWATDGPSDILRIRIWTEDGGEQVVYDSGDQVIGGGSIVVHTGGKGKK